MFRPTQLVIRRMLLLVALLLIAFATVKASESLSPAVGTIVAAALGAIVIVFRDFFANILSGITLIWSGTVRKDDIVRIVSRVSDEELVSLGWVDSITLWSVQIKDRHGVTTIIPNSIFTQSVIENWTTEIAIAVSISVTVAPGSDISTVRGMLIKACRKTNRILSQPPPRCLLKSSTKDGVTFVLQFWINDPKHGIRNVCSQVLEDILALAADEGITIAEMQEQQHFSRSF
jgi:small-conductance mechanosensitive channel